MHLGFRLSVDFFHSEMGVFSYLALSLKVVKIVADFGPTMSRKAVSGVSLGNVGGP